MNEEDFEIVKVMLENQIYMMECMALGNTKYPSIDRIDKTRELLNPKESPSLPNKTESALRSL